MSKPFPVCGAWNVAWDVCCGFVCGLIACDEILKPLIPLLLFVRGAEGGGKMPNADGDDRLPVDDAGALLGLRAVDQSIVDAAGEVGIRGESGCIVALLVRGAAPGRLGCSG